MANVIIPVGAAAAGWWVGGATGAAIGWTLGSSATAERENIDMPKIGDLRVQTSEYGRMIPFVVGKQRIAGNIIWATDKVPVETTERRGKGGFSGGAEVTITTYTISMAIALCAGPILGVTRMWQDGTIVAEAGSGQTKLPGTLYLGDELQTANSRIATETGEGAQTPDFRGLAYIVMEDFDLGASGRVPFFSFEVLKEGGF